MRQYFFSALARQDLSEIWHFTVRNWGRSQADRYFSQIETACESLASNRCQGKDIGHVMPGYYQYKIGAHLLIYRADSGSDALEVIRILHQRMYIERHLQ